MRAKHWEKAAAVLLFAAVGSSCSASRTYRATVHTHHVHTHVHVVTVGHRDLRIEHRHRAERGYRHKHDEREMHRVLLAKGRILTLPARSNKGGHVHGKQRAAEVGGLGQKSRGDHRVTHRETHRRADRHGVKQERARDKSVDRHEVRHDSARVRSDKARKERAEEHPQMAKTKVKKVAKARGKDKDREPIERSNKGGDVREKDRAGEVRAGVIPAKP